MKKIDKKVQNLVFVKKKYLRGSRTAYGVQFFEMYPALETGIVKKCAIKKNSSYSVDSPIDLEYRKWTQLPKGNRMIGIIVLLIQIAPHRSSHKYVDLQ
jgi:hypothetical protein